MRRGKTRSSRWFAADALRTHESAVTRTVPLERVPFRPPTRGVDRKPAAAAARHSQVYLGFLSVAGGGRGRTQVGVAY